MEKEEAAKFLEGVIGRPLKDVSSEEELGRLLLENMKFAIPLGEGGELHFPRPHGEGK